MFVKIAGLRASVLVPVLCPPLPYNGELLADGGLLNNLPVDVMRKFCDGPVVAIDASVESDLEVSREYRERPGNGEWLWRFLRHHGKAHAYPSLLQIFLRSATLSSTHARELAKRHADFYLRPPIDRFRMLGWEAFDDIVEAGYQYGVEAVQTLKPLLPRSVAPNPPFSQPNPFGG